MKTLKKIGILTFHDGINHGAYLQVYALHNYLKQNGYQNEIINYKNFKHWFKEYKCFLYRKSIKDLIENIKKIIKFKKSHKKLKFTKFTFSHKKVSKKNFETIIIGSDVIWDLNQPLLNRDYDSIYFGKDLNVKKIISYAASFGSTDQKEEKIKEIKKYIEKFNAISVRDKNSFKIIKGLINQKVPIVLDPIFLYNFSNEIIECPYSDFILIYDPGKLNKENIDEIESYAKKINKKTIAIGYKQSWCDINVVALDPFEWLGYFQKAKIIITTAFHGTVFAIKYNKEFATIVTRSRKNKFEPLITNLELAQRILQNNKNLEKLLSQKIDYDITNQKLNILIKQSKKYLINSL